jgi:PhnB protein
MVSAMKATLHPRLVVRDAPRALEFYAKVFDATISERHTGDDGKIVHAAVTIGEAHFSITEEQRRWHNDAPPSLGGSPVILGLDVEDVDALGARLVKAGAEVVFPIDNQYYGRREGRLRDPFGHLWILSQPIPEAK